MRVFYDATLLGGAGTGIERLGRELLSELVHFDLELTALIAHPKVDLPQGVKALPIFSAPKDDAFRVLWQQTGLPALLKQHKADLYFSPAPEGMFFPGAQQVVSVLDTIPLVQEGQPGHRQFYRWLLPQILRQSRAVMTISENSKRDIQRFYPFFNRPIWVAYPSYRREIFYRRDPAQQRAVRQQYGLGESPLVLFLGEARPYKNIGGIMEAFALAGDSLEHHRLVIAGRLGDQETPLREKARQLGIQARTYFLGFVPDEDLAKLYSACQVFVFASLYEGFGIPPLEAMACGAPVVLSDQSSLPEVGGDAVVYANPYQTAAIAEGIRRVLSDTQLEANLRQRSLQRAQQFEQRSAARALYQGIRSLNGSNGSNGSHQ